MSFFPTLSDLSLTLNQILKGDHFNAYWVMKIDDLHLTQEQVEPYRPDEELYDMAVRCLVFFSKFAHSCLLCGILVDTGMAVCIFLQYRTSEAYLQKR